MFFGIILILEIGLLFTGRLASYSEKNFGVYQSAYDASKFKPLFVWGKNDSVYSAQTEFAFSYQTNQYGLLKDPNTKHSSKEKTIVFLGDSFVLGVGAPQDSSLPVLLEKQLNTSVINAGIPGSDPFFEKRLIDSIFKVQSHHNYLLMLNFSDIYDYVIRGGEERFINNSKVQFHTPPAIEKYYQHSFIVRAFCHQFLKLDYSLLNKKELEQRKTEAIASYLELVKNLSSEVNLIVIIQPYARQYANNSTVLAEVLNFDYLNKLALSLEENQIQYINLDKRMQEIIDHHNYLEYSWEIDGHYNAKGYRLISEILAEELTLNYPEFFNPKE